MFTFLTSFENEYFKDFVFLALVYPDTTFFVRNISTTKYFVVGIDWQNENSLRTFLMRMVTFEFVLALVKFLPK